MTPFVATWRIIMIENRFSSTAFLLISITPGIFVVLFKSETHEEKRMAAYSLLWWNKKMYHILYKYSSIIQVMVYQGCERRETFANSIEMVSRTNVIRTLISLVTMGGWWWTHEMSRKRDRWRYKLRTWQDRLTLKFNYSHTGWMILNE